MSRRCIVSARPCHMYQAALADSAVAALRTATEPAKWYQLLLKRRTPTTPEDTVGVVRFPQSRTHDAVVVVREPICVATFEGESDRFACLMRMLDCLEDR